VLALGVDHRRVGSANGIQILFACQKKRNSSLRNTKIDTPPQVQNEAAPEIRGRKTSRLRQIARQSGLLRGATGAAERIHLRAMCVEHG
jgi:hypothetical protein